MKHLEKFAKLNESSLSPYTDVWVSIKYGDTSIRGVFLNRAEAQLECDKSNKILDDPKWNNIDKNRYVVKSLDDAISMIVEVSISNEKYPDGDW